TTKFHTNQYGVGKAFLTCDEDGDGELEARATDTNRQVGTWTEHYWRPGLDYLRLDTGRTTFRTGEPVAVPISAPPGDSLSAGAPHRGRSNFGDGDPTRIASDPELEPDSALVATSRLSPSGSPTGHVASSPHQFVRCTQPSGMNLH